LELRLSRCVLKRKMRTTVVVRILISFPKTIRNWKTLSQHPPLKRHRLAIQMPKSAPRNYGARSKPKPIRRLPSPPQTPSLPPIHRSKSSNQTARLAKPMWGGVFSRKNTSALCGPRLERAIFSAGKNTPDSLNFVSRVLQLTACLYSDSRKSIPSPSRAHLRFLLPQTMVGLVMSTEFTSMGGRQSTGQLPIPLKSCHLTQPNSLSTRPRKPNWRSPAIACASLNLPNKSLNTRTPSNPRPPEPPSLVLNVTAMFRPLHSWRPEHFSYRSHPEAYADSGGAGIVISRTDLIRFTRYPCVSGSIWSAYSRAQASHCAARDSGGTFPACF